MKMTPELTKAQENMRPGEITADGFLGNDKRPLVDIIEADEERLQSLEVELLGLRRSGDIPGDEIPHVYFDWVRRRDARLMARVFEHNRQDIVSLAALAVFACRWVEEGRAEDPRDVFSLARVLERARLHERCEAEYRRALELGAGALKGPALLRLGWRAKRAGDFARAARIWEEAGQAGEPEGWRELAMHHEHRTRDDPARRSRGGHARSQAAPSGRRIRTVVPRPSSLSMARAPP